MYSSVYCHCFLKLFTVKLMFSPLFIHLHPTKHSLVTPLQLFCTLTSFIHNMHSAPFLRQRHSAEYCHILMNTYSFLFSFVQLCCFHIELKAPLQRRFKYDFFHPHYLPMLIVCIVCSLERMEKRALNKHCVWSVKKKKERSGVRSGFSVPDKSV